jgi:uncharacterized protein (TIGR00661 family)
MRILYGVQGTGHGHISRARVILPKLREFAEVDVLISGYNFNMNLEGKIKYKARGLSLKYDRSGSVDIFETMLKLRPISFLKDYQSLSLAEYDFVVNDFEPITAWAAQKAGKPCIAISHQASFMSKNVPRPLNKSKIAEGIIKHFAPFTDAVSSHYLRYDHFIEPPIIREQIKQLHPNLGDHVTVYLPAFDHESLCSIFNKSPQIQWHIFSPTCEKEFHKQNVWVRPVGKDTFLDSFENSLGIVSSTGFETTSEALYLGKKLLTIPIKNQYEQLCNAVALEKLGGYTVYDVNSTFPNIVKDWLINGKVVKIDEISDDYEVVKKIIAAALKNPHPSNRVGIFH